MAEAAKKMVRVAALALSLLLVVGAAACGSDGGATTASPSATASAPADTGVTGVTSESPAVEVAEVLRPSVVDVRISSQGRSLGVGSGVIYRADGVIVTNNHVVVLDDGQPAERIVVTLASGERLVASIVGRDAISDLAVLRVEREDLPAAVFLRDIQELAVGQYAIAIGSPLGFGGSVTMGIISAIDREVAAGGSIGTVDLIQTDAAINPGNSGGALADARGRVIGINVAVAANADAQAQNIGFAIPSDLVVDAVEQILAAGAVSYSYLGIQSTTVTESLQEEYGLSRSEGVLVLQIEPGSPAQRAGLQVGDIIVSIGGEEVTSEADLFGYLRTREPGSETEVIVDRDGTEETLKVELGRRPTS